MKIFWSTLCEINMRMKKFVRETQQGFMKEA